MKLLPLMTVAACIALALGAVWSGEIVEARVQLDDEGLAISGTLKRIGSRELVPNAIVELQGDGQRGVQVATDAAGRFVFEGLAPGSYDLIPRPCVGGWQGFRRVEIGTDGFPRDVELWFRSWSRISGRVVDADGQPVAGAAVFLDVAAWQAGSPRLAYDGLRSDSPVRTDEDGQFEFWAIPGRYYLELIPSGDPWRPPQWYPDVLDPSNAVPLDVTACVDPPPVEMRGIEPAELHRFQFTLSGVRNAAGIQEPLDTYLDGARLLEGGIRRIGLVGSRPGWFMFEDLGGDVWRSPALPPGEYEVLIRYNSALWPALRELPEWRPEDLYRLNPLTRVRVSIEDSDQDLANITAGPRARAPGRVVVRSQGADLPQLTDLRFRFQDVDFGVASRPVEISAIGAVVVGDLTPGLWGFAQTPLPSPWYVASVMSGGRDVLREGLEAGSPIAPIEIVVADDGARIQGIVRDGDSRLVPDASVVLIPTAARRGPMLSFPSTTADAGGVFSLEDVPPGDYRLLSVDSAGLGGPNWESPDFLRQYELRGERITVDPKANMTMSIEAIPYVP